MNNQIRVSCQLDRRTMAGSGFALSADLTLPAEGITVIFGPSGCGKTTLLRCIAGLDLAEDAEIVVQDTIWQDHKRFLPVHQRKLGYVFQEASLLPHLTAEGNLRYAAKRSGKPQPELWDQVVNLLSLSTLLERKPDQLSGGERQRVALARALLSQPSLLLMDEPLASLDLPRKQEILPYLEQLRSAFKIPVIYVTHAMDEVTRLADYLVLMDQGEIQAAGPVEEVLSQPSLAAFFGDETSVLISGCIAHRDPQWGLMKVSFSGGDIWIKDTHQTLGDSVRLRVLARDVSLSRSEDVDSTIQNRLRVSLVEISDTPDASTAMLRLKCGDVQILARVTQRAISSLDLKIGEQLWAQIKTAAVTY